MKQYWTLALCLTLFAGTAAAQGGAVTVSLGDAVANPGDTVEVPVYLTAGTAAPTVLILFVRYDPDKLAPFGEYYEFILTDALGKPATDDRGNTLTVESAVRPEPALTDAKKLVETGILPDGVQTGTLPLGTFSIGVFGFDFEQLPIPEGKLFTLAFEVLDGADPLETLVIEGVGADDPIQVTGEDGGGQPIVQEAFSNAADANASRVAVNLEDGLVTLGCVPATTPANVSASQNRGDGVLVEWDAIAEMDAEYRVFRSTLADVNTALPLGEGWTTATSFLDLSAAVPINVGGGCVPQAVPAQYFYWVKARLNGCESEFQGFGVAGFRTAGKALQAAGARGMVLIWAAVAMGLALGGSTRRRKV